MKELYQEITSCRVCEAETLTEVMDFGQQYLASTFVPDNTVHPLSSTKVPLTVLLCDNCGLLQLKETVRRETLYHDYFYRSATNPIMRSALKDVIYDTFKKVNLRKDDYVLDIGCNDGTMLSFVSDEYRRIGVEPATNISWQNIEKSIHIINDFFSGEKILEVTGKDKVRLVTSTAMLYAVEDLNAFASQVKSILADDGVWCIQVSYLSEILRTMSFYDVCHEHLYYFSLATLSRLLERNGFSVFDASVNNVNGGSLRVFVTHTESKRARTDHYSELIEAEERMRLTVKDTYQRFMDEVHELGRKLKCYINTETERENMVIGLGASTKGNVLLQFFGIDKQMLPYISERNPEKVGLRTLGTDIELISEEQARALNPACMLVLIWFFKEEIIRREHSYLQNGGKLLFPMPFCSVVTKDGETRR